MLEPRWPNSARSQLIGPESGDQYLANSGLVTAGRYPGGPSPELRLGWDQTPPGLHVLSGLMLSIHLPTPLPWTADPTGAFPDLPSQLEGFNLKLQAGRRKGRQIFRQGITHLTF